MKKSLRLRIVIAVLIICIYVFLSPFVTVYYLISDGVEGNAAGIVGSIDKAILKDNVKTQLREAFLKKMSAEGRYGPFRALSNKFALDRFDPMIDEMMSTTSIKQDTESMMVGNVSWMEKLKIKMGLLAKLDYKYKSLSEFAFYATPNKKIEITLSRSSLIIWKITNVTLPPMMLP